MTSIQAQLNHRFIQGFQAAFGPEVAIPQPLIVPASNPKFGDYQCNAALPLAKPLQQKPRDIAQTLLAHVQLGEMCEEPELAGPGFINLRLKPDYLAAQLARKQGDSRLGVAQTKEPQRVIVDFSSPNIAKEMHVGHLRSTIIGDCLARILEFRGHEVVRLNHVGDWGTQFGMLITYLKEAYPEALTTADALDLGDLVALYKQAKQRFDQDEVFQQTSREAVVALQAGDEESRRAWQLLCDQSRREFQVIYDLLDIEVTERGESFYNPLLPDVLKTLAAAGILQEDQGAQCVFLEGFSNKDGQPLPLIVQKSDGGFNYATTDLAALHYRIHQDEGDRIIYVTDAGQANHFTQVFQVARRAGILTDAVEVVHVPFGLVQGEDGKKLKTRSGETVRLRDLLDEAVRRTREDLEQRLAAEGRRETEAFKQEVAQTIGLSAVKYADLSQNRTSNYIFSYDKMLSLQGNTSPYLLYAYVRIQGIQRKAAGGALAVIPEDLPPVSGIRWRALAVTALLTVVAFVFMDASIRIHHELHTIPLLAEVMRLVGFGYGLWFASRYLLFPSGRQDLRGMITGWWDQCFGPVDALAALPPSPCLHLDTEPELVLAKHLLQLEDVLAEVEQELFPNRLCQYLFELSQKFNQFFEQCPVLKAAEPVRSSRLALCELTADTLKLGLSLLGIPVLDRI
ncbi:arginine--tRNA ligase [Spirulina sp. CCNP1310]|uniref:arginine--tRNA ligase n=1 Tax=Spirulina sp. CCNP1310 TaxID=3110249 RepID=UPI002B1E9092|nr:arginine--tRNA ligase [Spirulina sp. CCNP1310]MEA5419329.1 arginine--tRNA ligase [Spirulina sp. CCNP1310]